MVAHMAGNAGGPPPPSEREAQLLAELEACQAKLRAARAALDNRDTILDELAAARSDRREAELRAAREREQIANSMSALLTDIAVNEILADENIVWARELLADYDKATGEVPR